VKLRVVVLRFILIDLFKWQNILLNFGPFENQSVPLGTRMVRQNI